MFSFLQYNSQKMTVRKEKKSSAYLSFQSWSFSLHPSVEQSHRFMGSCRNAETHNPARNDRDSAGQPKKTSGLCKWPTTGAECNYRVASLSESWNVRWGLNITVCQNWMKYCWHRQTGFADAGYKVFDGFSQAARTSDFTVKLSVLTCHVQQCPEPDFLKVLLICLELVWLTDVFCLCCLVADELDEVQSADERGVTASSSSCCTPI